MRWFAVIASIVTTTLLVVGETLPRMPEPLFWRLGTDVFVLLYLAMVLLVAWKATPSREAYLICAFLVALAFVGGVQEIFYAFPGALWWYIVQAPGVATIIFVAFLFPAVYPPRRTLQSIWLLRIGLPLSSLLALAYLLTQIAHVVPELGWAHAANDIIWFPYAFLIVAAVVEGTISGGAAYRVPSLVAGSTLVLLALVDLSASIIHLEHWNAGWFDYGIGFLRYGSGIGMTYAVLRHRLVDLHLVVSRAAIFSAFSLCLIALFVAVEWVLILIVERAVGPRFNALDETTLTAIVALGIGVSARGIHHAVEARLNRVFFAKRYRALAELHRYALETDAATDAVALVNLTVSVLRRTLDAGRIGLYAGQPDTGYRLLLGDAELPARLGTNEELVLRLRRWGEPLTVENDDDALAGSFVCPMVLRGQLYGFVICGRKRDRTSYLPDEREALASLVHRVGIAYEWLTREAPASPSLDFAQLRSG